MKKQTLTFSFKDQFEKIGKKFEDLAFSLQQEMNQAVSDTAEAAYASIVAEAQANLDSTRTDYLQGLEFGEVAPGHYVITLDGTWANALEDGFPSFDLREKMLKSQSRVTAGSRAGEPWVQTSKKGHKFAHVPIKRGGAATMGQAIKDVRAVNAKNRMQKITKVFKDIENNPLVGKVAIGDAGDNHPLKGVVKYQQLNKNNKLESLYILYRTVSEAGKPWIHPGYAGLGAFEKAEESLVRNLNQIIKDFSGKS